MKKGIQKISPKIAIFSSLSKIGINERFCINALRHKKIRSFQTKARNNSKFSVSSEDTLV